MPAVRLASQALRRAHREVGAARARWERAPELPTPYLPGRAEGMLAPVHDHPQSVRTIERWFHEAGLRDVEAFRLGVAVGRGRK